MRAGQAATVRVELEELCRTTVRAALPAALNLPILSLMFLSSALAQITTGVPGKGQISASPLGSVTMQGGRGSVAMTGTAGSLSGNGAVRTLGCGGRPVTVSGNHNRYTLTGSCPQVMVSGNDNTVSVALATAITVSGNSNRVSWNRAANGKRPAISVSGNGDRVSQR